MVITFDNRADTKCRNFRLSCLWMMVPREQWYPERFDHISSRNFEIWIVCKVEARDSYKSWALCLGSSWQLVYFL